MFLAPEYLWLEPVIFASIIVFMVDLIGNFIVFGNRFFNALATAIIFGLIFGSLSYYGYGDIQMSISTEPALNAPAATRSGS